MSIIAAQKIEFSDFNLVLNAIKCVLNLDNIKTQDVDKIEQSLEELNLTERLIAYWYLAQAYFGIDEKDKAQNCHESAKSLLSEAANKNSKSEDRDTYLNNIYFHKRLQEDLKEKSKPPEETSEVKIFTFCPSCGFNNSNQFAFCPQCGQDLKST